MPPLRHVTSSHYLLPTAARMLGSFLRPAGPSKPWSGVGQAPEAPRHTQAHHVFCYLGFGFSFGVFQDYYSSHLPFKGSGEVAVVGTTALVSYSSCPPSFQQITRP